MQDFRNLEVWRLSHELTLNLYRATQTFPSDERFGLTSQLRRAACSVELNLAEGSARGSDADFSRFVQMSVGSASEIQCQLLIARDLRYLNGPDYDRFDEQIQQIKRMLSSLLKTLRKSQPL